MKKIITISLALTMLLSNSVYAMSTAEFDKGMNKGIAYYDKKMYYEAKDEFQWFCDYNWGKMNEGQQKYALDYLDGAKAKIIEWENYVKTTSVATHAVYNGSYSGGGTKIPSTNERIGVWHAKITNATSNSIKLSFSQAESDYSVTTTLYRQSNGSYYGAGYSSRGTSYITVWLETPQRMSLTVSGAAEKVGTEYLYK